MRADGRGRRECRGNARGPGRIRGVAPRGPGLPARSACAHGTAGGAEPKPCRRWRLRRRKRRRIRPVRAYVAREGEHPRRPDGRPRARGGGGLWARSASARKDRGPERSARRPETAARRDRERSALRAVAEETLRAAGDREASASGPRREGGRRAEPRGAHGRLRGDATSPAGCRATRAGRARARRGERTREAPLPALPADAERARGESENLFERSRADGRRRQGSLCSFTPVAVDSAFSYENVRQNGGTRRCTSAIRHHLLCLIARRTGVLGRREKGKLFCLGALPAAPAPHFTLFRATVWRQREKVSTSGAGRARGPRCPAGAMPASGAQGTWVRGCIAPRPSATLPRRLLRRRVHAAAAAKPQRVRGARIARPGATAGAARRAVLLAPSPYPGCLRGSDARERCAKASEAPGKGRPARARAHGERRRERCRARARWGLAVPRAGGPRAPWGGFYA